MRFDLIDSFGITFPLDLDIRIKAVLLAAVFLIDFLYFEQPKSNSKSNKQWSDGLLDRLKDRLTDGPTECSAQSAQCNLSDSSDAL